MKKGEEFMAADFTKNLGQCLRQAREKLGLTLEEVASNMGFANYQTLSAMENGTREIKAYELAKLSKIYLRSISYFLNPEPDKKEALVAWRNRSDNPKVKLKEQEFLKYCTNYYDLEKRLLLSDKFTLPQKKLTPDSLNNDTIKEMADEYSHVMQLGSRPACSLKKILEEKYNVKILYLDLGDYGSAASAVGDFGAAVLLNSLGSYYRKNFDLAHELFHIISWESFPHDEIHSSYEKNDVLEKWANVFASNLLLPQQEVETEINKRAQNKKVSLLDIIGVAREFVVSTEALLWRLVALRFLNENLVKGTLEDPQFKDIDEAERVKDSKNVSPDPYISSRYVNLAFKAYQKGLISRGKLAEYLGKDRSDIAEFLEQYGYKDEEQMSYAELTLT